MDSQRFPIALYTIGWVNVTVTFVKPHIFCKLNKYIALEFHL
jgi:hypothetical protein